MQLSYLFLFTRNILLPIIVFFPFLFLLPLQETSGAEIEIPSSFNPVGSGARALGMGGAFIAVADDATAASWNPGGLTQLKKPECSIVLDGLHRREDISFGTKPEGNGDHTINEEDLNYLSVTYPFEAWGRNMVVSLAYQHLYDFYREWDFTLIENTQYSPIENNWKYNQEGSLSALGLSYSVRIIPKISLGVTFNFWDDDLTKNSWKQEFSLKENGVFGETFKRNFNVKSRYSFEGFNMNIGLLWRINYGLTLGAVLKTPFTADIERKVHWEWLFENSGIQTGAENYIKNEKLDVPMSYGIGLHYNFSDNFSMSADIYKTEWEDYIYQDEDGKKTSPISRNAIDESDIDSTYQVRIGAEYRFINKNKSRIIPLRFGIFYDPSPAEDNPDDFYGFSMGVGLTQNDIFSFDIAYQYRYGNGVNKMYLEHLNFSQDVTEHKIYASLILYKW